MIGVVVGLYVGEAVVGIPDGEELGSVVGLLGADEGSVVGVCVGCPVITGA